MKRFLSLMVSVALPLLVGCGGGGGGGGGETHPPTISNLYYSPNKVILETAYEVTFTAGVNFSDSGGDLATARVSFFDNTGTLLETWTEPIEGVAGEASGTIEGYFSFNVTQIGDFTIHVQVTDATGSSSNVLVGTFHVINPQYVQLPVGTPLRDSVPGDDWKFYDAVVTQGVRYTVGITGLSGRASLFVYNNDNTLQTPECSTTNSSDTSLPMECSLTAYGGQTGSHLYIEVDGESPAGPVSYTIFTAPNPIPIQPASEGSRQAPVTIPCDIPTQGQVETRGTSYYMSTGLLPGQPYTVNILGLSEDADLHVYSDETYSWELDCTLLKPGDVTSIPESCTTTTGGTLYFSIGSGELNQAGAGYLIFVE